MRTVLVLLLSVSALSALSACGLRGDLVRPMPLWGNPPLDGPTDPRVIKAAEEAEAAEKERQDTERRAADEARRLEMQRLANPPAPEAAPQ